MESGDQKGKLSHSTRIAEPMGRRKIASSGSDLKRLLQFSQRKVTCSLLTVILLSPLSNFSSFVDIFQCYLCGSVIALCIEFH